MPPAGAPGEGFSILLLPGWKRRDAFTALPTTYDLRLRRYAPPPISPSPRHFSKMAVISASAAATESSGDCCPVAARAIMFGRVGRAKISPIAALAGPGWPRLVVQSLAVFSNASLSAGCEPYGSLSSQLSRSGTVDGQAGKL